MYVSMARIYYNTIITGRNFGDISQLKDLILDSGVTCYTTQEIADFSPVSFTETDKYIEIADGNFVTEK